MQTQEGCWGGLERGPDGGVTGSCCVPGQVLTSLRVLSCPPTSGAAVGVTGGK